MFRKVNNFEKLINTFEPQGEITHKGFNKAVVISVIYQGVNKYPVPHAELKGYLKEAPSFEGQKVIGQEYATEESSADACVAMLTYERNLLEFEEYSKLLPSVYEGNTIIEKIKKSLEILTGKLHSTELPQKRPLTALSNIIHENGPAILRIYNAGEATEGCKPQFIVVAGVGYLNGKIVAAVVHPYDKSFKVIDAVEGLKPYLMINSPVIQIKGNSRYQQLSSPSTPVLEDSMKHLRLESRKSAILPREMVQSQKFNSRATMPPMSKSIQLSDVLDAQDGVKEYEQQLERNQRQLTESQMESSPSFSEAETVCVFARREEAFEVKKMLNLKSHRVLYLLQKNRTFNNLTLFKSQSTADATVIMLSLDHLGAESISAILNNLPSSVEVLNKFAQKEIEAEQIVNSLSRMEPEKLKNVVLSKLPGTKPLQALFEARKANGSLIIPITKSKCTHRWVIVDEIVILGNRLTPTNPFHELGVVVRDPLDGSHRIMKGDEFSALLRNGDPYIQFSKSETNSLNIKELFFKRFMSELPKMDKLNSADPRKMTRFGMIAAAERPVSSLIETKEALRSSTPTEPDSPVESADPSRRPSIVIDTDAGELGYELMESNSPEEISAIEGRGTLNEGEE